MKDLPPAARVPLLVLGIIALVTGVLAGLARLGVPVPDAVAAQAGVHGALMIGAFFGTVISLERAVAIGQGWAYLGPLAAGAGGLAFLAGAPPEAPQGLILMAALVMVLGSLLVLRRQVALFTVVLAVGAAAWLAGAAAWVVTGSALAAVPWWLAFLILTIAGERLELTRFLPRQPAASRRFVATVAAIVAGAMVAGWRETLGLSIFGAGLLALSAWLLRYDIARHNARQRGLVRFIAVCLLSGYVWLAVGGALGLAGAFVPGHPLRDAALHAVALGFVFAMVFGHAPIIFPAVARVKIPYHPVFYLPLLLLHASLALRVAGAVADAFPWRQQGAVLNALTLLAFILTMLASVVRGRRKARTGPEHGARKGVDGERNRGVASRPGQRARAVECRADAGGIERNTER